MERITGEEMHARMVRAAEAAKAAGQALGLEVGDPIVLHNAFSVVVHLPPSPVVARVPMVLPPGMDGIALRERQQRELEFAGWLAGTGFPVVRPSSLVRTVPHIHDGHSMTFWELAEASEDHIPYGSVEAFRVVDLHERLREYPRTSELPFLGPVNQSVPALLDALQAAPEMIEPADLERALAEWRVLAPYFASRQAFTDRFPDATIQAVHGDAPSYNVIRTNGGVLFADFEDVCLAPLEWDLALGTRDDLLGYQAEATRRRVPSFDVNVLKVMNAGRLLQMVGSLALVPQLPLLAAGLKPTIDAWRRMPFAGGIEG